MIFEQHNNLRGKHAFLSPSQPQWLKYSKEQLRQKRISSYSQPMGTSLHELAETLIANGLKLKKGDKLTVLSHLLTDRIPREVIDMELRIYQSDEIIICNPTAEDILPIMDVIIRDCKYVEDYSEEE